MNLLDKPIITKDTFQAMEDMSYFIHSLIFDDLLIVAQKETNCFVLKSDEGLIVIDAIWPCEEAFNAIVFAIEDVGWNPADIKKLVLTHGHLDHTGCGKWIVEHYGAKAYLSKADDDFWKNNPLRTDIVKDFDIDVYIQDGDVISLGNRSIYVFETPGHTPGGLSYIFNVTENDQEYKAALWGGSAPPMDIQGIVNYMKSLDYFIEQTEKYNVEVVFSNHTAFDNGIERIRYSQKRMRYMPNIYVIGQNNVRKYFRIFRNLCYEKLKCFDK